MEWVSLSNGPGWEDVCNMLTALDSLHGCETSVLLRREGEEGSSRLSVTIISVRMTPTAELEQLQCVTVGHYPCRGHKTVAGMIYGALHMQDRRINQSWYSQQPIGW